jgi:hypothetical protein
MVVLAGLIRGNALPDGNFDNLRAKSTIHHTGKHMKYSFRKKSRPPLLQRACYARRRSRRTRTPPATTR